jgi:hypothetical protein
MTEPTYIFDNDQVYAMVDNKVVASASDLDTLERKLACTCGHGCEGDCSGCDECKKTASYIVTPNGLKGTILGRTASVWGEQVTVRLENGRIVSLPVGEGMKFAAADTEVQANPVVGLRTRLAASAERFDKWGLSERFKELETIKREAQSYIANGDSNQVDLDLNDIVVEATFEQGEIKEAMEALANGEAEAFEAPAPFNINVVEQGGPSRGDSWLDAPLGEMIAEAAATDYEKLMDEGPEAFVAELDAPVLADASTTRSLASSWIRSHTAAADETLRENYEQVWLARVEDVRRGAYAQVKEATKKEAAAQDDLPDSPDEALFG